MPHMTLINDFLSLIYPRYCEACERLLFKHENMICNHCMINLPKSGFHLLPNNPISLALAGRVPVEQTAVLYVFEKGGRVQNLLHAIKYEGQSKLAVMLGNMLGEDIKNRVEFGSVDYFMPIPLHPDKLKKRGYNQSEAFAKGIHQVLKKPISNKHLIRIKNSATQTRKHKFERWENVDGIFTVQQAETFENRHVLLIDDVITTGATLEAAWQALKGISGIKISVAAIAFAEK
jgi:ComF family protein